MALLSLVVPQVASAHARATSIARGADGTIQITLSSPVESGFLSSSGGAVSRSPDDSFELVARSDEASFRIRALSVDGHVTTLAVDAHDPTEPTVMTIDSTDPIPVVLGRLLMLAGLVLVGGVIIVGSIILLPAMRSPLREVGAASISPSDALERQSAAWMVRIGTPISVLGLVGVVLCAVGLLGRLESKDVVGLMAGTRVGHVLDAVALGLSVCIVALRGNFQMENPRNRIVILATLVAMAAISAGGHATSGTDAFLGGLFDFIHLVATALWIGGLAVLLKIRNIVVEEGPPATVSRLGAIVVRFSSLAIVCVGALVVTGTYRALAELSAFTDLTTTSYGRALTAKLILFAGLLCIGAYNRFVIHPRLERAAIGLADSDRNATLSLRQSVRAEISLAIAVLAIVAIIIGFAPPA